MHTRCLLPVVAVAALVAGSSEPAVGNEFAPEMRAALSAQVEPWLTDAVLVEAVRAQNAAHSGLGDAEIAALDQQWRAEGEAGELYREIVARPASQHLIERMQASDGLIMEMFVTDARGLNVAQTGLTSDYMQGDEPKWQRTFAVGPDAVHVEELEFDDSVGAFVGMISRSIADPQTGETIGAISVAMNIEKL